MAAARDEHAAARQLHAPHYDAITAAQRQLTAARGDLATAERRLQATRRRGRRDARHHVDLGTERVARATDNLERVSAAAKPSRQLLDATYTRLQHLEHSRVTDDIMNRWSDTASLVEPLRQHLAALDIWRLWATGHTIATRDLTAAIRTLGEQPTRASRILADNLTEWAQHHGIQRQPRRPTIQVRRHTAPRSPELGLGV